MMKTTVKTSLTYFFTAALILIWAGVALAGNRMYFGGFNQEDGGRRVLLVWGDLEGSIPSGAEDPNGIDSFKIYRKQGGGNFIALDPEIPNALVSQAELGAYFNADQEARNEIITLLDDMVQDTLIDSSNYLTYLHNIIDEDHADFSRFKQMLLIRFSRHVARALGRAFVDTVPGTQENTYIITGMMGGVETKPLGKTTVAAGSETILSAPENFSQVEIGGCSDINRFMDHEKVHFNWTVPSTPQTMALRTMIYGYDIYRTSQVPDPMNPLSLRDGIPAYLTLINPVPIVASGNTAADGADAFLASDGGRAALSGTLNEGDTLYYYLVARDLSGKYSETPAPITVIVPDRQAPVMPWNVHTQRETVEGNTRMTLLWEQINADNYKAFYSRDKEFCAASPTGKVCFTKPGGDCTGEDKVCLDIDVARYRIYRFDSPDAARSWGPDSDGDGWTDAEEEGVYDPCDKNNPPASTPKPAHWVGTVEAGAPYRNLNGKNFHYFHDPAPNPDNIVHWYRIAAVDDQGNVSPLTPPVRAVLWDRTQPMVDAEIHTKRCVYSVKYTSVQKDCEGEIENPGGNDVLYVWDDTPNEDARIFQVFERCVALDHSETLNLVYSAPFRYSAAVTADDIAPYSCETTTCSGRNTIGGYIVRFFGENGRFLAQSESFASQSCLSAYSGCVILERPCDEIIVITPDDPEIQPVDPTIPLNVCVTNLTADQCVRVYRQINGNMTPITSWCQREGSCSDPIDLRGIVTTDICLGVRVFSKNGVGSPMTYFNCIPVLTPSAPKAPLMEGVTPIEKEGKPYFKVRWSAQSEGISAFIVKRESESGIYYDTLWDLKPDETTGQFSADIEIEDDTRELEWCFQVRAMDTTLTLSGWSDTRCRVWGELPEGESLGWPHVKTPVESGEIIAVIPFNQATPMLILSDSLNDRILEFISQCANSPTYRRCTVSGGGVIPDCGDGQSGCFNPSQFCCDICGAARSWNKFGRFMVYRQEEDKDFIQISPLVETIHCDSERPMPSVADVSTINDPLVHLVSFLAGAVDTGRCSNPSLFDDINSSQRLVFGDWFPYTSGKRVRYKVLVFGNQSGEPEKVYTSGWLKLP